MLYVKGVPTKIVTRNRTGNETYRLGLLVHKETDFGLHQEILPLSLPKEFVQAYQVYAGAVDDTEYLIPVEVNIFNGMPYYRITGMPTE